MWFSNPIVPQAIADWLANEVSRAGGGDSQSDPVHTRRLIEAARSARERLSTVSETEVELPFSDGRPSTSTATLTRFVRDYFAYTIIYIKK